MDTQDIDERVRTLVSDYWAGANVRDIQINNRIGDFVRGRLYFVSIYDAENVEHENYVYVVGNDLKLFTDTNQLALGVGRISPLTEVLNTFLQYGGIPGIMAILITLTSCYLAMNHVADSNWHIPDILGNALNVILGFYFGAVTHKRKTP